MYESRFGKREGLKERLAEWAETLSHDNRYPWAGLGIIADLKLAAEVLPDHIPEPKYAEFDL